MKFKWLWHWKDDKGISHLSCNRNEVEKVLHNNEGKTIWAERIPSNGIRRIIRKRD